MGESVHSVQRKLQRVVWSVLAFWGLVAALVLAACGIQLKAHMNPRNGRTGPGGALQACRSGCDAGEAACRASEGCSAVAWLVPCLRHCEVRYGPQAHRGPFVDPLDRGSYVQSVARERGSLLPRGSRHPCLRRRGGVSNPPAGKREKPVKPCLKHSCAYFLAGSFFMRTKARPLGSTRTGSTSTRAKHSRRPSVSVLS